MVTSDNVTITLNSSSVSNVAFMLPKGYSNNNNFIITSNDQGRHLAMVIAPSTNGLTTCPASGTIPNLSFNSLTTSAKTQVFLYTPCNITIQNGGAMTGQIYSGTASYPTNRRLTIPAPQNIATVPGVSYPGAPSGEGPSTRYPSPTRST